MTDEDPLSPDAPIYHLLSIKHNPMVKDMNEEQLADLIKRLRTLATSPQTMSAKLQSESTKRKRPMSEAQLKRKALLDSL